MNRPPPRPPPRPSGVDPRVEPDTLPPMRARTASGHDPIEEVYRRLDRLDEKAGEIRGHRERLDGIDRTLADFRTKLDDTGQHVMEGTVAASTYKAVIEEERRKRAEVETALANKNAEIQRDKRTDLLTKAMIAVASLIIGGFARDLINAILQVRHP